MAVEISKQSMVELADIVAKSVVTALKESGLIGTPNKDDNVVKSKNKKKEMNAYQKTEALLFSYVNFNKILKEKEQEIADLRKYGVPAKSSMSGGERVQSSRTNVGIVLPEDAVEDAVRTVERSVEDTVHAVALIDKCMAALKNEPYYDILPMRYFEGRTLEDIGVYFGVDHTTISRNKSRLVRELSMRMFPNDVAKEMMQ